MNFKRSEVRNNCFRKKNGVLIKNQGIIDTIDKLKGDFKWEKFSEDWDVYVTASEIKVVRNIRDINKVSEICIHKYVAEKKGFEMDPLNDEEEAIIHMIEAQFLEGKMSWSNYRESWGIRWDDERKRIETYLLNVPQSQLEVTEEMIQKVLERGTAEKSALFDQVNYKFVESTKEE